MQIIKNHTAFVAMALLASILLAGCETLQQAQPRAALVITPDKTVLSQALLKEPIRIMGSGFEPNETVIVDLIVPKEVKVKGLGEEEKGRVGIANATADEKGNFTAAVGPSALLNTFFQVGWNLQTMKPDFKQAKPLPPGRYTVVATGAFSERVGESTLELLPAPSQK